jgi:hypothetical protein
VEKVVDSVKKMIEGHYLLDLDGINRSLDNLNDIMPGILGIHASLLLLVINFYKVGVETKYKAEISNELFDYLYADVSAELVLAKEDAESGDTKTAYERCRTILQKILIRLESGKIGDWASKIAAKDKSYLAWTGSYSVETHLYPLKRKVLRMLVPLYRICKYVGKLCITLSSKANK